MDAKTQLRKRVGDTPLLRSPKLSQKLGLPNLYLKLEGANPTGTQKDRVARLDVAEAARLGKKGVTCGTCGNYGVALAHAAYVHGIACHIFTPEDFRGERVGLMEDLGAIVHRVPGMYEDAVKASNQFAVEENLHDANPGGINTLQAMTGYTRIADEILDSLDEPPAFVGVPVGNGTTLAGVHLGFRAAWARGTAKTMPAIAAGTSAGNNPLDFDGSQDYKPMRPDQVIETEINEPLVNWDALDGRAATEAVHASGGATFGVTDAELMELHQILLEDGIEAHPASLASVHAVYELAKQTDLEGCCVAILTSGRPQLHVEAIEAEPSALIGTLLQWLGKYGDPVPEVMEAVTAAAEGGYILEAKQGSNVVGYCILTPMELDTFFPHLHLSYIAVSKAARGQGVGTSLLEAAIRAADGDLSLHVDVDNQGAIRLYEKFGFTRKYFRMLRRPGRTPDVDTASGSGWDAPEGKGVAETVRATSLGP
ncbi:MAG: pyridoxal-phosphate dependent enzyme [Thermoplasmatota archaeon]